MNMIVKMASLDWLSIKGYHKYLFFSALCLIFLSSTFSTLMIIPMCAMGFLVVSINTLFAVEEKGESYKLYLTLPAKKHEIVAGRYFLSFMFFISSILTGIGAIFIQDKFIFALYFVESANFFEDTMLITVIGISYLFHALFSLCLFPLLFWFGYTKGKVIMWVIMLPIYLGFTLLFGLLGGTRYSTIDWLLDFSIKNVVSVNIITFAAATVVLILSYFLSVNVYSKRDF